MQPAKQSRINCPNEGCRRQDKTLKWEEQVKIKRASVVREKDIVNKEGSVKNNKWKGSMTRKKAKRKRKEIGTERTKKENMTEQRGEKDIIEKRKG